MADSLYSSISMPSEAKKKQPRSCLGAANKPALLDRPSDRCGKTLRGVCDCVAKGDAIPFATLPIGYPQPSSDVLFLPATIRKGAADAC